MGAADSKPINKLFEHYSLLNVHNNDFPECKILQHKHDPHQQLILRAINITDEDHFKKTIHQFQSRQKINHPNILNLSNYFYEFEQQLCGQFYKVNLLFEYPQSNLDRVQTINEIQLIDYLKQAISGLACLQRNQISHNTLQLRYLFLMNGVVKVSDPQYFQQNTNYVQILQNPNCMESIYLSPTLVNTIRSNNWWPKHNQYKSDLFTLGMLFLHLSLNQVNSDCYNYTQGKFLEDQLTIKLQKLRTRFGQQFCNFISMMLIIQEDQRPDLIQMEQIINQQGNSYYSQQQVPNVVPRQIIQPQPIGQMETIHQPNSNSLQLEFAYNTQNNQSRRINQVQAISPIEYAHQYTIKTNSSQRSSTPVNKYTIPIQQAQLQTRDRSLPKQKTQSQNASSRQLNYEYQNKNNQLYTHNKNNAIVTTTTTTDQSILSNKNSIQQISLPPKQSMHQKNSKSAQVNQQTESNILPIQVFPASQDQCDSLSKIFHSEMCSRPSKFDVNIDAQQDEDINTQRQGKFESSKILSDSTNLPQQIKNTITKEFSLPCETSQIKVEKADGAEFVVEHYGNGSRYEGMKMNGMRHGQGRFYYQDGGLYDGEWKENKMHGEGKLYYGTGQPAYEGKWNEDQFDGFGTLYNEHPQMLEESFDYRDFDYVEDYWIKYSGNFWMDNKEGQGSLHLTNGERFVGQFERDLINGRGVFYRRDGKMMEGRWVDNKLVY
ncbi:unnamed protein product (macronuclear) [Paramecium tetraurelia]|uniref:Protein kinase domain-containing protein n=1 Tax=Paramecium tetraurelia TaxID=5888 RepID=A0CBG4_PARTE|nr:uncharacterized protein GSPATT00036914001 [Paramecium tetraurelia]CAK68131.1 unnamed protein product [Paramecium tetraurelia]|eukprot:XP_001435528.1 hypothetical protein (macronuclear) [Paramecium tetraurelia strain d4-2]